MEFISFEKKDHIGTITLQNEKEYNVLSWTVIKKLDELFKSVAEEREVKVIIIQGSKKVLSAGHSLREIEANDVSEVLNLFQDCYDMMKTVREIPQIVIAKVHGVAVAAGCQLVAICDLALASEEAKFSTPGINSGLFCSTPAVFLSRNIGRKKACEMLFTGNFISAREALEYGLVNKVVPLQDLDNETEKMAEEISKQSLNIIELGKRTFYEQLRLADFEALNYATQVVSLNTKHPDAVEGIRAFFEKRAPLWND